MNKISKQNILLSSILSTTNEASMGRGGARPGAGRKKGSVLPPEERRKTVNVRVAGWVAEWLKGHPESSGRLIERALK